MNLSQHKLGELYHHINKAKELQSEIVSQHGEKYSGETREEIVKIWNALDECGAAIHKCLQYENLLIHLQDVECVSGIGKNLSGTYLYQYEVTDTTKEADVEEWEPGKYDQMSDPIAFKPGGGVCYVPELGDRKYTYEDFVEIAKGNIDYATLLFSRCTWQHPETLVDEDLMEGEIIEEGDTFKLVHHE